MQPVQKLFLSLIKLVETLRGSSAKKEKMASHNTTGYSWQASAFEDVGDESPCWCGRHPGHPNRRWCDIVLLLEAPYFM